MARKQKPKVSPEIAKAYFNDQRMLFSVIVKQALTIGNRIGVQVADERRVMSTWLFMRVCVSARSIEQLFDPPSPIVGDIAYLDHGSIAALARGLIENIAVLLYVGDPAITEEEWKCRKCVIDIHDCVTRSEFLTLISQPPDPIMQADTLKMLQERVKKNPAFQALPAQRQKRLQNGEDMFVDGRHKAMMKIGWGDELARGIYKYLSNHAHTMPMAFHRTAENSLYERDSPAGLHPVPKTPS